MWQMKKKHSKCGLIGLDVKESRNNFVRPNRFNSRTSTRWPYVAAVITGVGLLGILFLATAGAK